MVPSLLFCPPPPPPLPPSSRCSSHWAVGGLEELLTVRFFPYASVKALWAMKGKKRHSFSQGPENLGFGVCRYTPDLISLQLSQALDCRYLLQEEAEGGGENDDGGPRAPSQGDSTCRNTNALPTHTLHVRYRVNWQGSDSTRTKKCQPYL